MTSMWIKQTDGLTQGWVSASSAHSGRGEHKVRGIVMGSMKRRGSRCLEGRLTCTEGMGGGELWGQSVAAAAEAARRTPLDAQAQQPA